MNPFVLNFFEILKVFSDLREKIKENLNEITEENLKKVLRQCYDLVKYCPRINFAIDKEDVDRWPNFWEIIRYNEYDSFSVVLVIAELILQSNPKLRKNLEILSLKDVANSRILDIIVIKKDNIFVCMSSDGETFEKEEIDDMHVLNRFVKNSNNRWEKR